MGARKNNRGGGKEDRTKVRDITYLDLGPQDNMCITRIRETKYSTKLLHGEIADVANFELGGLARDPRGGAMSGQEQRYGGRTNAPGCPSLILRPRSCPR